MALSHLTFFLLNLAVAFVVFYIDRKRIKSYVLLIAFGLVAAFIFETATTAAGFWQYHSQPKIFLISLYSWLLYIPYLSFCYFIGNRFGHELGEASD